MESDEGQSEIVFWNDCCLCSPSANNSSLVSSQKDTFFIQVILGYGSFTVEIICLLGILHCKLTGFF